jgi:hypothetical protein
VPTKDSSTSEIGTSGYLTRIAVLEDGLWYSGLISSLFGGRRRVAIEVGVGKRQTTTSAEGSLQN